VAQPRSGEEAGGTFVTAGTYLRDLALLQGSYVVGPVAAGTGQNLRLLGVFRIRHEVLEGDPMEVLHVGGRHGSGQLVLEHE
jgi:hypothetical protein